MRPMISCEAQPKQVEKREKVKKAKIKEEGKASIKLLDGDLDTGEEIPNNAV